MKTINIIMIVLLTLNILINMYTLNLAALCGWLVALIWIPKD